MNRAPRISISFHSLASLLGLWLLAAPQAAAQDGPASLWVTVRSEITGRPLRGAEVTLLGVPFRWRTDENGVARLKGLAEGPQTIYAAALGHAPAEWAVVLAAEGTGVVALALGPEPIALDPIRVRGAREEQKDRGTMYLERRGFFRRQRTGFGAYLTRAELERDDPRSLSDAMRRISGMTVLPGRFSHGSVAMTRSLGSAFCSIRYVIDGIPTVGFNLDDVPVRDVEGIEIYRGASEIPAEFNSRRSGCGVIVIWTRPGGN